MAVRAAPLLLVAVLAACNRQPTPEPRNQVAVAAPPPSPSPVATSAADLSRYVGKYPFDRVGKTSFVADPAVRRAVSAIVPDTAVRETVLGEGTATPIVEQDGRLLAWACEAHNCGPHNWAIAITPDARAAAVCYYDQDANVSRWWPAGYRAPSPDGCPSGADKRDPSPVRAELVEARVAARPSTSSRRKGVRCHADQNAAASSA